MDPSYVCPTIVCLAVIWWLTKVSRIGVLLQAPYESNAFRHTVR